MLTVEQKPHSELNFRIYVFLALSIARCFAANYLLFDEDDSLGSDYYDAGIGSSHLPSFLELRGSSSDKLPIVTNAFRGETSALLHWSSKPGGDWELRIYNLGFAAKDISKYSRLELHLNGPAAISAELLPTISLEDSQRNRCKPVLLGKFLTEGLDGDKQSWEHVSIPLTNFLSQSFNGTQFLSLVFTQGAADGNAHELWLDDLRFTENEPTQESSHISPPVFCLIRAGDGRVNLHWKVNETNGPRSYEIYRSTSRSGKFTRINQRPLKQSRYADLNAQNNNTFYYKIKAFGDHDQVAFSESSAAVIPSAFTTDHQFLDFLQASAFDYFTFETSPRTGLVRDRSEAWSASSIAAVGFGLTAIGIGIDHGWISREEGRERTLKILSTLQAPPQNSNAHGSSGYNGWFYHFLDADTGSRFGTSELSSIDTALLLSGVLYSAEYFNQASPDEVRIRALAGALYDRVDWNWMLNGEKTFSMGWSPEEGFIRARWEGYNEASILYLLALGKVNSPLGRDHWDAWTHSYEWKESYGMEFIHFPPLFGHQYSACWVDYRKIVDDWTAAKGITYFENSRRATLAQQAYAIANPKKHPGYGTNLWGFTACDGPGSNGYFSYIARGAPPSENEDGTIAPTAAGGSMPFTPRQSIACLKEMYYHLHPSPWGAYGFQDAFNLEANWQGADVIGIDQGPILLMIENYRGGSVWKQMSKSEILKRGLARAGFRPVSHNDQN